ncbi:MAG: hypothetical protein N4A62_19645 [Marinisporobacter sp.]|jgi:hypothetical protein|nr:hypothetical protein [Marinisporobacter sp.]
MRKPQVHNNISIEYKNDKKAKEKFVNYIVDFIMDSKILEKGGEQENTYGKF